MDALITAKATIKASYSQVGLGWQWRPWKHFTWGMGLGWITPSGATTDLVAEGDGLGSTALMLAQMTEDYKKMETEVKDQGTKYGNMAIPSLVLLNLGFAF